MILSRFGSRSKPSAGPKAGTWRSTCWSSPSAARRSAAAKSTAAAAILGRQALLPDADGNIWWTGVLEDSVKHTVGVSKDLREGIRLSIEIIANDVVRRRAAQGHAARSDRRAATGQARAALPLPNPVPAVRRSVPGAAGAAVGRTGVRRGLRPGPAAGTHAHRAGVADSAKPAPTCTSRWRRCSGWWTAATPRRPRRRWRRRSGTRSGVQRRCAPTSSSPKQQSSSTRWAWATRPTQRVLQHLLLSKESKGRKGCRPRLHLLRRTRHQPARRGVRGADVLHRVLRRGGPLRGRQERRPGEGSWVVPVTPRRPPVARRTSSRR